MIMATVPKLNTVYHEGGIPFKVEAPFVPMGDQPTAIHGHPGARRRSTRAGCRA